MKGICYIIGAGDVFRTDISAEKDDYIICADAGYKFSSLLGREADLVVGDFDSLGRVPETERKIVAPCEKDETDMVLAIDEGLKRGYKRFVIFGALGGERMDHSFANIQALNYICHNGAVGFLVHGDRIFTAIRNSEIRFNENCKGYISVFSLTDESRGVRIKNLRYEVDSFNMKNFQIIGASNEFLGKEATVSVEEGVLLITWCGRHTDSSIE